MKVTVLQGEAERTACDAWLVFALGGNLLLPRGGPFSTRLSRRLRQWIPSAGFAGKPGEVAILPSWDELPARFIVIAGLGPQRDLAPWRIERAAATAMRTARRLKLKHLRVSLGFDDGSAPVAKPEFARQVVLGLSYGSYQFTRFLSSAKPRPAPSITFAGAGGHTAAVRTVARDGAEIAGVIRAIRDVANLPANEASPTAIAREAQRLARAHRLSCRVAGKPELQRMGCNAILAVARGSHQDPCVITLKYPGRSSRLRPVVLVGKTLTFDTGGISLKPAKGMEWMRYDKCGGMAVLGAILAAARLRLRRPVIAILAAAENMPGGNATRPGDIVRTLSGKTVEILNTDAEGRLVLADALALAARHKPCAIVDLATLTGACVVALGHVVAGIMGNQPTILRQLTQAGELSGDRVWELPLLPEYGEGIRGQFSDLKNIGNEGAGAIVGASFLRHFVPDAIPWAHVDIAGTAWDEKDVAHGTAGATAFGVKLLTEWVRGLDRD